MGIRSIYCPKEDDEKTPMSSAYFFVRNATLGRIIGGWCFLLTAASCIMGIYSEDRFIMIMNIIVPLCLIGPGLIMPLIAKKNSGSK